jgi:anthranilate 1,2-dioxygenase large subunit
VQQISNSLATRQILPKSATSFELVSTFFAYADDDEATVAIRLKQANLAGPAGYISLEDGYAIELVQQGIIHENNRSSFIELGDVKTVTQDGLVSEASIRGFWGHYRRLMQPAA